MLCFMAATITFWKRSTLAARRSEWYDVNSLTLSMPISVAFSRNHSVRSLSLVGAMAISRLKPQWSYPSRLLVKLTVALFGSASTNSASKRKPSPLVTQKRSPSVMRSTLTQCFDSSSGKVVRPSVAPGM